MPMEKSMEKKEMALRPDEIDLANHYFFVDEVPPLGVPDAPGTRSCPLATRAPSEPRLLGRDPLPRHRGGSAGHADVLIGTGDHARGPGPRGGRGTALDDRYRPADAHPPEEAREQAVHPERGRQYEPFVRGQARLVLDRARPKGEFDFVERSPESCRSGSSPGSWASRTLTYLCAST
jgi:hypothetical protein